MAALVLAAVLSQAQVFEPVRNIKDADGKRNSVVLQISKYDWGVAALSGDPGILLAADFALGDEFGIGFWYANDTQSDGFVSADLTWSELHFDWFFSQQENSTLALTVGALRIEVDSLYLQWSEFGLVGSTALDADAPNGSEWTLGYNLGRVVGSSGSFGAVPFDGWTYGLSVAYRFDESWSANASWYVLNLTSAGGANIRRVGIGVGYRF